jgi:hypothetical protein
VSVRERAASSSTTLPGSMPISSTRTPWRSMGTANPLRVKAEADGKIRQGRRAIRVAQARKRPRPVAVGRSGAGPVPWSGRWPSPQRLLRKRESRTLFGEEALRELKGLRGGVRPTGEHFVRECNDWRREHLRSEFHCQRARFDFVTPFDSLEEVGPRWSTL